MEKTIKVTRKELLDAVTSIREVAAKEKWVFTLDKDEGSFFYSPKTIPEDARLYQVTDEYSVYLNGKKKPSGVMVAYFGGNYVKHHPEIGKISKVVFSAKKDVVVVNPSAAKVKKEVEKFKVVFESMLIAESFSGGHCDKS